MPSKNGLNRDLDLIPRFNNIEKELFGMGTGGL